MGGTRRTGMIITPQRVEHCVESLKSCRVAVLEGDGLDIRNERGIVLAEGLKHATNLDKVSLIKNGIGPVGAAQIAAPLAACAKLREINLFRNQLLDAGAETLCSALAAGACNLEVLWLGDNKMKRVPDSLLKMSSLRRVYLNNNSIAHAPPELARLESLKVLDLDGNVLEGLPVHFFLMGLRRLQGPRWELLREHLLSELKAREGEGESEDGGAVGGGGGGEDKEERQPDAPAA